MYHIVEIIPNEDGPCGDYPNVISWTHRVREGILHAPYAAKLASHLMWEAEKHGCDCYFEARDQNGRAIHFADYLHDAHVDAFYSHNSTDCVPF